MTGRETERDQPSGDDEVDSAPLSDLADLVDERRRLSESDTFEKLFAERPFEATDHRSVWEERGGTPRSESGAVGEVTEAGDRTHVVPKRTFCEQCRFSSEPPTIRCTHEGSEILEFVDKDHVRVYSCPVVRERGLTDDGSYG